MEYTFSEVSQDMVKLSEVLKKYYKKKGNKILFRNQMTLNQLALTMWEKLDYKQIDVSVLSRVINGERLFTYRQLETFCCLLYLNNLQKQELQSALIYDILNRYNINYENQLSFDIAFLSRLPTTINSLREEGRPNLAIELSTFFETFFTANIKFYERYKSILAKIYNEKSRTYGLISPANQVLTFMEPLNNKAIALGEGLKNQEI